MLRARVIVPPSWGDEGFAKRRYGFGALVERGLELWFLEGPFFGTRRLGGSKLTLSTVEQFLLMGLANVVELRAVIGAARADGVPLVVAGYSMAGQLAAQAVATLPWELPVVSMAPSDSAGPVFVDGPLSGAVHFDALGFSGRRRLAELLFARSRVQVLPPPRSPKRVVVANRHDGIVPPSSMERLAQHWGVAPRWIESGHLGAFLFHRDVLQGAIESVL